MLSLFSLQDSSHEEADDPIGVLSLEEAVSLYEPMIRDFMDQELYLIDTRQDLNRRGMQILTMKKHVMRLQFKFMYETEISMDEHTCQRWEAC